jgi:abi-like protein
MKYEKPPIILEQQIQKLKKRGLLIPNDERAKDFLCNISYYRLRAYTYPFQDNTEGADHQFLRDDLLLDDVVDLYYFDVQLRSLLNRELGRIEIALRTRLSSEYSTYTDSPFWYLETDLFHLQREKYNTLVSKIREDVKRSKEDFVVHYYKKYGEPDLPPSWMMVEVISMGLLSKLFAGLDKKHPAYNRICGSLGLKRVEILPNWMHALTSLRNVCAHHSRLWNRRFTIELLFPRVTLLPTTFLPPKEGECIRRNKLFAYISVLLYLSSVMALTSPLKEELITLLKKRPKLVKLKHMGFPDNWQEFTLWNI